MQCRSYAAQLGRHYAEIQAAGYEVLVILGESTDRAGSYTALLKLPFPVLADPDQVVYHRYGLDRVLFVIQRTASIVVDRAGIIRYLKEATNPMGWLTEIQRMI